MLQRHLIWKLLGIHLVIIAFVMVIVWMSIDYLAAGYFVTLMEKYHISPEPAHAMFVDAVHRYLIWACFGAIILAVVLSFFMMRRVLAPLSRMTTTTREIAAGNFGVRVPVATQDEVGQLAVAFNRMAKSLQKLENLRKAMMIDVAHELRTPLTNIQGYLEALMDSVVPPSTETYTLLHEEILRLAQLSEDILQLAKADAATGDLHIEALDPAQYLNQVLERFKAEFKDRGIATVINGLDGAPRIAADGEKLAQVLNNLFDNALRYTPRDGRFEISTTREKDQLRFNFTNTGGEISAEDLPFIFERFYRGEKSRSREHGGAGIGLAIVKELIEAQGGKVGAAMPNGGTRVWFTLPIFTQA